VLNQRDFIQIGEEGKSIGKVKLALLSQISLTTSPRCHSSYPALDLQLYLMRCQQVAHDPADQTMLDVIAVVGQGDSSPAGFSQAWLLA
jgi:hypothetical protein